MQRQRGELVPIGEVVADLDGPVKALRKTPPPARRSFTVADQVNQLVGASEADPDLGFMARTMALCSLPRTNPGNLPRPTSCGYLSQMDTPLHPVSWLTPSRPNTVVPPAFRFRDRPVPHDRIPNNRVMASAWESDPDRRS